MKEIAVAFWRGLSPLFAMSWGVLASGYIVNDGPMRAFFAIALSVLAFWALFTAIE